MDICFCLYHRANCRQQVKIYYWFLNRYNIDITTAIYQAIYKIYANRKCTLKCSKDNLTNIKKKLLPIVEINTELWPPYNPVMEEEYNFVKLFNCVYWETCDFQIIINRSINLIRGAVYHKTIRNDRMLHERSKLYEIKGSNKPMYYTTRWKNNEPFECIYWFVDSEKYMKYTESLNNTLTSKIVGCEQCVVKYGFISSNNIYEDIICVFGGSNYNIYHLNERKLKHLVNFEFNCHFWKRHSSKEILNCIYGEGGFNFHNANLIIDMFV